MASTSAPGERFARSSSSRIRRARVEVTAEGRQTYQRIAAERAAILSERVAGLPPEQADALVTALPALENLAEDLRAAVRRGRGERA